MTREPKKEKVNAQIWVDVHEKESEVYRYLKHKAKKGGTDDHFFLRGGVEVIVKNKNTWPGGYEETADYCVVSQHGKRWGVERKSWADAYKSICIDKKLDGQLAMLCDRYPNHAILLIEGYKYKPDWCRYGIHQFKQSVLTYASRRGKDIWVMYALDCKHTVELLVWLALESDAFEIEGRGYKVVREE